MHIDDLIASLEELREAGLETVEVHYQQNYPLASRPVNVRKLGDKAVIALGSSGEYGDSAAWSDDDDEVCEECGCGLDSLEELDCGLCTDCDAEVAA